MLLWLLVLCWIWRFQGKVDNASFCPGISAVTWSVLPVPGEENAGTLCASVHLEEELQNGKMFCLGNCWAESSVWFLALILYDYWHIPRPWHEWATIFRCKLEFKERQQQGDSHFQSPVAAPRRSWLNQVGPGQRGHLDKLSHNL